MTPNLAGCSEPRDSASVSGRALIREWACLYVRARFTLADGTQHLGYLTPAADPNDLGTLQPQIVTEDAQVGFWMGVVRQDVGKLYGRLGKTSSQTFPVSYESDVPLSKGPIKGSIPAFLHLPSVTATNANEVKSDHRPIWHEFFDRRRIPC